MPTAYSISTPVKVDSSHQYFMQDNPNDIYVGMQTFGTRVKNGFKDPDWRIKVARREDATQSYYLRDYDVKLANVSSSGVYATSLTSKRYNVSGSRTWEGGLTAFTDIPSNSEVSAANDIALKRIKGKLARDTAHFKSLVPLGEIKELRELAHTTNKQTSAFLSSVYELGVGRKVRTLKKVRRAVSGLWLNYSFAIAPTISMMQDIAESINKTLERDHHIVLHGQKTVEWKSRYSSIGSTNSHKGAIIVASPVDHYHKYRVRYTAGFLVRIQSLNNYAAIHSGFTAGEVFSTAYELSPFSWVLDYVSTVGDVLEDVFEATSGETYYCTKSYKYTCESHVSLTPLPSNIYSNCRGPTVQNVCKTVIFGREKLGSLPHRSFRMKTNDEIGINAIPKLLNLAAILAAR